MLLFNLASEESSTGIGYGSISGVYLVQLLGTLFRTVLDAVHTFCLPLVVISNTTSRSVPFSSVQFIDSMQQLHHDRMIAQIRTRWKRTKRHQSALTIALKLGLEKQ